MQRVNWQGLDIAYPETWRYQNAGQEIRFEPSTRLTTPGLGPMLVAAVIGPGRFNREMARALAASATGGLRTKSELYARSFLLGSSAAFRVDTDAANGCSWVVLTGGEETRILIIAWSDGVNRYRFDEVFEKMLSETEG
jgi:hypothetical protein